MKKLLLLSLICSLRILPSSAQTHDAPPVIKVDQILKADGTIDRQARHVGTIDFSGYDVKLTNKGPVFKQATSNFDIGNPTSWSAEFGALAGLNGTVNVIKYLENSLYVGGEFVDAGGNTAADYIARWDGNTWHALGTGLNGTVRDFVLDYDGKLVVVGDFTNAGGDPNGLHIARWDGSIWTPYGQGLGATVHALLRYNGAMYFGTSMGLFKLCNPGQGWCLQNPELIDGAVYALENGFLPNHTGDILLVGGQNIAVYLEEDQWHEMNTSGDYVDGAIFDFDIDSSHIYAGGDFTLHSDGETRSGIAMFLSDYNSWGKAILDEGDMQGNKIVYKVNYHAGGLYAAGDFVNAGGPPINFLAFSDNGFYWTPIGPIDAMTGPIRALEILSDGDIYIGGSFLAVNGHRNATRIAHWDGSQWNGFGNGLNNTVYAVAIYNSSIYVGGNFSDAGGNSYADGIARWDGEQWHSLKGGVYGTVYTMSVNPASGMLYAGGAFEHVNNSTTLVGLLLDVDNIAVWDGYSWSTLAGGGVNGQVLASSWSDAQNALYIGGSFTSNASSTTSLSKIAKWTANTGFTSLGTGLNGSVAALKASGPNVYAGGSFTNAGANPNADYIARWNGSTWSTLGAPLNGPVYAIEVSGPDIFVGGNFTNAGNIAAADYIARSNGSSWSAVGAGLNGIVRSLAVWDGTLYAGGDFFSLISSKRKLAYFDGTSWQGFYNGVNGSVNALAAGENLYVGGGFTQTGADLSMLRFGIYSQVDIMFSQGVLAEFERQSQKAAEDFADVYPTESSTGRVTVELHDKAASADVLVQNIFGERILQCSVIGAGELQIGSPPGIYLVMIWQKERVVTKRIIIKK